MKAHYKTVYIRKEINTVLETDVKHTKHLCMKMVHEVLSYVTSLKKEKLHFIIVMLSILLDLFFFP